MSAPEKLRQIDESDWDSGEDLLAMELAICGLTHGELGATACRKWQLPPSLCDIVQHHHSLNIGESKTNRLLSIIRFADIAMFRSSIPGSPGLHEAEPKELERFLTPHIPPIIGGCAEDLRRPIQRAADDADAICSMLGIG